MVELTPTTRDYTGDIGGWGHRDLGIGTIALQSVPNPFCYIVSGEIGELGIWRPASGMAACLRTVGFLPRYQFQYDYHPVRIT